MRLNFDLEYCQNNGVLAIRPTETGCLGSLVRKTKTHKRDQYGGQGGDERMWIFCDVESYCDKDGDERINHHRAGVRNGTYQEGSAFIQMCRELGLVVESGGFFVPFSNGESRYISSNDGEPLTDYNESELKFSRWDLPTREQLALLCERQSPRHGH